MNKLKAVVVNDYLQRLLLEAHCLNEPSLVLPVLDNLNALYLVKKDRLSPRHTFIKTHTKSTRQLVDRCRVLLEQPEHAASNVYPEQSSRRVFDWCLGNFGEADINPLKCVLLNATPPQRIRSAERFERWQDARQELIGDILTLCEIVLCYKAVE